ncbi:MAG: hypothetical protein CME62_15580 [Halobacteriovoraceae bacterium]|nr:hypothetical protein [Halobacteriovoraceae bacterium]
MKKYLLIITTICLFIPTAWSKFDLRSLSAQTQTVQNDLEKILAKANLEGKINFVQKSHTKNSAHLSCEAEKMTITVEAGENWSQVFYYSLQKLGFYFPHPRIQVSPKWSQVKENCGKTIQWKTAMKYHGFHLHTLHPSEWVHGFLMGKTEIANDMIRWMARNQQNTLDLSLLDIEEEKIFSYLKAPFKLAKDFGIHTGVVFGFAFHQQNQYKLVSLFDSLFEERSLKAIDKKLNYLLDNIDLSFINIEAGTSEFTPANYELSIKWMNKAAELAEKKDVATFIKIHTSTGQENEKYGNFNFLPQFANSNVGILPHTVFLYELEADDAPMYGNKNFHHIRDFMLDQKDKRNTWYYPETSYFCVQDIDVPLFFTDYLLTRANDSKFLYQNGIQGQLNFSTGQEVGYWLFDWTYTLLNNLDYEFDPYIGLKLLGEDVESWKKIAEFQNKYFVKKGLVSIITFSSLGDELLEGVHNVLKRNLLSKLSKDPKSLDSEIALLEEAIPHIPKNVEIKNKELRSMWKITEARIQHAYYNRLAMKHEDKKESYLAKSKEYREKAQGHIDHVFNNHGRYPAAQLFSRHDNPTAYKWGYAQPAKDMQYWIREEESIRANNYAFYFMSQFSIKEVLEGWVF